jgi:hypothetical protein
LHSLTTARPQLIHQSQIKAVYSALGMSDVQISSVPPPQPAAAEIAVAAESSSSRKRGVDAAASVMPRVKKERTRDDDSESTASGAYSQGDVPAAAREDVEDTDAVYAARTTRGDVVGAPFNAALGDRLERKPLLLLDVALLDGSCRAPYRHMNEPIHVKAEALDAKFRLLRADLARAHGIAGFADHHIARQAAFVTCGRICLEAEGRLDAHNVVLEARSGAGDASVAKRQPAADADAENVANNNKNDEEEILDAEINEMVGDDEQNEFTEMKRVRAAVHDIAQSYSLFPGQIVAMRGTNPSGRLVDAAQILTPPAAPTFAHTASTSGLRMLVACGPFSTAQSSAYAPLADVVQLANAERVDVLVLVGPFVDAESPVLRADAEHAPSNAAPSADECQSAVSALLSGVQHDIRVVCVPSTRDLNAHLVFPQPPLARMGGDNCTSVPNPATFVVNDVCIGTTSSAVVQHLSSSLTSKLYDAAAAAAAAAAAGDDAAISAAPQSAQTVPADRMAQICRHLLEQRSYYPLFPPAKDSNVVVSKFEQYALNVAPDVCIVPCDLKQFVTVVDRTVFVNPGRLAKSRTGGTVAFVTVHSGGGPDRTYVRFQQI